MHKQNATHNIYKCFIFTSFLFFYVFCSTVFADVTTDLTKADIDFQLKNYESAIKVYLPLAEQGNAHAQTKMGLVYTNGYGLNKDLKVAYRWFEKAAAKNHADGEYYYATFLLNGYGIDKNPEKSLPWFEKSANQGNVDAQTSLASMYMIGLGTKIDYDKAFMWNQKAAKAGNTIAMYNLGQLYEKGSGTIMNMNEAVHWYEQCAKADHVYCQFELGYAFQSGKGGYPEDLKKAIEWYEKSADKGNANAQFNLYSIYSDMSTKDKSKLEKAMFYLKKSAELGSFKSQTLLADHYINGVGVEKNPSLAIEWLTKAAEKGYGFAQKNLGLIYLEGKLTYYKDGKISTGPNKELSEKWLKRAFDTWEKAAKNGNVLNIQELAIAYQYGLGVDKDYEAATKLYLKLLPIENDQVLWKTYGNLFDIYKAGVAKTTGALNAKTIIDQLAENNELVAIKFLARFYNHYGTHGDRDAKLARYWYGKFAETGDMGAKLALARLYAYEISNEKGVDANQNYSLALKWYQQVAENDQYPNAKYELAELYLSGQGGGKNEVAAIGLLTQASNKGHLAAKLALAKIYQEDKIDKKNNTKALEIYMELAKSSHIGNGNSIFKTSAQNLSEMHELGLGVNQDATQAYVWQSLMIDNYTFSNEGRHFGIPALPPLNNLERDSMIVLMIGSGDNESKKIKLEKEKLKLLENQLSSDELKKAKKMIENWKSSNNI